MVRVRSQRLEGHGSWARKESGVVGRVTLSVAEVSVANVDALRGA
jgi:DnaJ-related protein SCJ1